MTESAVLGFPRIGAKRELKNATERYWRGDIPVSELRAEGHGYAPSIGVCNAMPESTSSPRTTFPFTIRFST